MPTKILIVDDETDILDFLSYNLQKEGFEVVTAENGQIALKKAIEHQPSLIVLDMMMPEMDGLETCRQIRNLPNFRQTAICFLTAKNEDLTQIETLDAGADDFIAKPIKPQLFISRIKALLRRTSSFSDESILKVGHLEIDKTNYSVKNGENLIELPKKEFELLVLLASKMGRVFTREEIYAKLWGDDIIVGDRTLDVYIRKLREKVGIEYIKTLKGVGYKFEI